MVHPIYKLSTLCLHVLTFSCEIFMLTIWSTHAGWLQVNEDFFTIIAQVLCEGSWRQYSWYVRRCKWSGIMKIHCIKCIFWYYNFFLYMWNWKCIMLMYAIRKKKLKGPRQRTGIVLGKQVLTLYYGNKTSRHAD